MVKKRKLPKFLATYSSSRVFEAFYSSCFNEICFHLKVIQSMSQPENPKTILSLSNEPVKYNVAVTCLVQRAFVANV